MSDKERKKWEWYRKIKAVIASCKNGPHAQAAYRLISMFGDRYEDEHMKKQLRDLLMDHSLKI